MHLKRRSMPKTWPLQRKDKKFVAVGSGTHKLELSLPLIVVLRDLARVLSNMNEAKKLLKEDAVEINGKIIKEIKTNVGLLDRIHIKKLDKSYSIHMTDKGKLCAIEISKAKIDTKPCKIIGKKILKRAKVQVNCDDGRNFLMEHTKSANFKVGDTLIINLKSNNILRHLNLAKGAYALITSGRNSGKHGKIESIEKKMVMLTAGHKKISVPVANIFVLEEEEFKK